MKIIRSIKSMQRYSRQQAVQGLKIGLVPTMGFLHEGHLSLIRRAKKNADFVITTIFVNPAQFSPHEDLDKYPRDEKGDLKKIESAGGDLVFIPKAEDIYGSDYQTYVNVEKLTCQLEGKHRPTHFRGVTTIVAKLLNITRSDVAVFGQKDYQQAMVIKKMAKDLDYPVKIIVAPIVREKDGLAMSSRNKYFSPEQRPEVVCLYKSLTEARRLVRLGKEIRPGGLKSAMRRIILEICPSAKIDYIAITNFDTLRDVKIIDKNSICSLAANVHGVRLIDNMMLM